MASRPWPREKLFCPPLASPISYQIAESGGGFFESVLTRLK